MTQPDLTLEEISPPRRNRALRLFLWVLITLCGLMMAAILLSDPSVTSRFQPDTAEAEPTAEAVDTGSLFSWGSSEPEPEQVVKPAVLSMPTNRIPVRRAGN